MNRVLLVDWQRVPLVTQLPVNGHPVSYNPDDEMFYVHAPGTTDGSNVVGKFRQLRNLRYVISRRRRAK